MADDCYIIVNDDTGEVVNAVVGLPSVAAPFVVVAREGAAIDAAIGMIRQPDGTYAFPGAAE